MNFFKSLFSSAIGLTTGVSPWLMVGLFAAGLIAGGTVAYVWQQREIDGLETSITALNNAIDGDQGYKAQVAGMKIGLTQRNDTIARLNAQIEKITTDAQNTQQATLELLDAAEARADATERKMADLRRKANAATDAEKPKQISPSARAAAEWGLCRAAATAAGRDPGAC